MSENWTLALAQLLYSCFAAAPQLLQLLFIAPKWEVLLNLKILCSIGDVNTELYSPPFQENMLLAYIPKRTRARGRKGRKKNARWHDWFLTSSDKKEEKTTGPYQSKYCYLPQYIGISNINQPVPFKRHFLIAEESHSCWQLIYKHKNAVSWTTASLGLRKCRSKWCPSVRFFHLHVIFSFNFQEIIGK